ncbi:MULTISPECIES: hypothetical protein [unclassified Prochlorococcus]|uniref:hypothetical protein n=1 Tax=unclassified Prochlorococcus TaxID=2627481 RepID=UPI000533BBD1|nr:MULTISPECIES: hypothetical protein [unclassified Prochlorococcus]KGG17191.1 hypothetical protein EV07_0626 [Prochlorococcus sp. MIT 0603]
MCKGRIGAIVTLAVVSTVAGLSFLTPSAEASSNCFSTKTLWICAGLTGLFARDKRITILFNK